MVVEARGQGAAQVVGLGTMGMRNARNSEAFIAGVHAQCAVKIEVIGGREEPRLAYLAVQAGVGLPEGADTVFDTGGGSTQVTIGTGTRVHERFSLALGAVRFTWQFGLGGPRAAAALWRQQPPRI